MIQFIHAELVCAEIRIAVKLASTIPPQCMYYYYNYIHYIVEPLNRGHTGPSHCREVVPSSVVQNVLTVWENEHLGP